MEDSYRGPRNDNPIVPTYYESWDRWYASLPDDLRRRLSIHDFKRLGDCFKAAFNILP
jgi:hypothetical protein